MQNENENENENEPAATVVVESIEEIRKGVDESWHEKLTALEATIATLQNQVSQLTDQLAAASAFNRETLTAQLEKTEERLQAAETRLATLTEMPPPPPPSESAVALPAPLPNPPDPSTGPRRRHHSIL